MLDTTSPAPWEVTVEVSTPIGANESLKFECDGLLISKRHVLTSIDCVVATTDRIWPAGAAFFELDNHYSTLQATDLRVRFSSESEEVEDFQFSRHSGRISGYVDPPSDTFAILQVMKSCL